MSDISDVISDAGLVSEQNGGKRPEIRPDKLLTIYTQPSKMGRWYPLYSRRTVGLLHLVDFADDVYLAWREVPSNDKHGPGPTSPGSRRSRGHDPYYNGRDFVLVAFRESRPLLPGKITIVFDGFSRKFNGKWNIPPREAYGVQLAYPGSTGVKYTKRDGSVI